MVEGRSAQALEAFAQALVTHGGKAEQIELIRPGHQVRLIKAERASSSRKPRSFLTAFISCEAADQVRKELARAGTL